MLTDLMAFKCLPGVMCQRFQWCEGAHRSYRSQVFCSHEFDVITGLLGLVCLTGLMGLASLTSLISLYFTNYSTTTDKEW